VARDFVQRNRRIAFGSALSLWETLDCLEDLPLERMDAKKHAGFTVLRAHDIEAPSSQNAPSVRLPTASKERSGSQEVPGAQSPTASKGPPSSQGVPGTPPPTTSNGTSSVGKEPASAVSSKEEEGSGGETGLEGELRGILSGTEGVGTKAGDMEVEEIESPGVLRARLAAEKGGQGAVTEERGRAGGDFKSDDLEQTATASGAPSGRISTPGLGTSQGGPLNSSEAPARINYSPEQLDVLAVLFTVVKILYIGGAVGRAHELATRVERARRLSEKPLHETMVRNEAAYFGCIYQVLTEYPIPLPLPDVNRYIFRRLKIGTRCSLCCQYPGTTFCGLLWVHLLMDTL
jgi:hypothetical protein